MKLGYPVRVPIVRHVIFACWLISVPFCVYFFILVSVFGTGMHLELPLKNATGVHVNNASLFRFAATIPIVVVLMMAMVAPHFMEVHGKQRNSYVS